MRCPKPSGPLSTATDPLDGSHDRIDVVQVGDVVLSELEVELLLHLEDDLDVLQGVPLLVIPTAGATGDLVKLMEQRGWLLRLPPRAHLAFDERGLDVVVSLLSHTQQ